jgi:hypothetical protein
MPWVGDAGWQALLAAHAAEVRAMREENAWLREQMSLAYAQQRQVERKEKNLPIRETKEQPPVEPIPADITALVNLYPQSAREETMQSIAAARQTFPPLTWQEIKTEIQKRIPPELLAVTHEEKPV